MACAGLRDLVMLTKQLDTFGARFADGTSPFSRFGLLFHHKVVKPLFMGRKPVLNPKYISHALDTH